jgi:hypothetical protein
VLLRNRAAGGTGAGRAAAAAGLGEGIFIDGPSPSVRRTHAPRLPGRTQRGRRRRAGEGGGDGQGIGGGVYNLGTFDFDAATLVALNHASDSNDDLFP